MLNVFMFAAAIAVSPPAIAFDPAPTAIVRVGDLDLATVTGQHVLARRIGAALEQVCGSYANAPDPVDQMRIGACRSRALGDAQRQIAARETSVQLAARR